MTITAADFLERVKAVLEACRQHLTFTDDLRPAVPGVFARQEARAGAATLLAELETPDGC